MALIPLGILSAAGAGGGAVGDYELIQTQILGSNQASVTFSNLGNFNTTYKHLQIRYTGKSTTTTFDNYEMRVYVDGDTGNFYRQHQLGGSGGSVFSDSRTSPDIAILGSDKTNNTQRFAAGVIDLLDPYSSTKNKVLRGMSGLLGVDGSLILLRSVLYTGTSSTTSLVLSPSSGSFGIGSRFSLYGIRG